MNWIPLENLDDPRLNDYRDLPRSNLTALSGRFVVEGRWMVERLVASKYAVVSVVVDERRLNMVPPCLPAEVPVFVLPARGVEQLIGFNFHRGVLACGRRQAAIGLAQWTAALGARSLAVVGVDIQDPTNLGGILRNCAAFGVEGVLLSAHSADPFSRRVLRVSMGTAFQLPLLAVKGLEQQLVELRDQHHFELIAAVLAPDAEPLESVTMRASRTALLIGNEGHGLPDALVAACQRRVTLSMERGTDSLNAAAASAVFLYHLTRVARCLV